MLFHHCFFGSQSLRIFYKACNLHIIIFDDNNSTIDYLNDGCNVLSTGGGPVAAFTRAAAKEEQQEDEEEQQQVQDQQEQGDNPPNPT